MTFQPLLIKFTSPRPITPFSPTWDFALGENNISNKINFNRLKKFLLSKEEEVLKIDKELNDAGTGLGLDSTTSRFMSYNVLEWDQEDIRIIKEQIILTHNKYYGYTVSSPYFVPSDLTASNQKPPLIKLWAWMNIMRKGEQIKKHNHGYDSKKDTTYLSGNFVVSCDEKTSKTIYINPIIHISEKEILEKIDYFGDNHLPWVYASKNNVGNLTIFPSYVPHFTTQHTSDTERITLGFEIEPHYENN